MHRREAEWLLNALRRGAACRDHQRIQARAHLYPYERDRRFAACRGLAVPLARTWSQLGDALSAEH